MKVQRSIPYFSKEEFLAAEDSYHETADALQEVISRFTSSQFSIGNRSGDSFLRESNNNGFQLPCIALPKFSGNLTESESFRNTFKSLVAVSEALPNTQKFHPI